METGQAAGALGRLSCPQLCNHTERQASSATRFSHEYAGVMHLLNRYAVSTYCVLEM